VWSVRLEHGQSDGVAEHQRVHVVQPLLHQVVRVLHELESFVIVIYVAELKRAKDTLTGVLVQFSLLICSRLLLVLFPD